MNTELRFKGISKLVPLNEIFIDKILVFIHILFILVHLHELQIIRGHVVLILTRKNNKY